MHSADLELHSHVLRAVLHHGHHRQELIEELPDDSSPSAILAHSLAAVGYLCTMKPALEPALETHLLRAALHSVFTLGTEKDTTGIQALHKVIPEVLDAMLGNLLAESPDTDRLHFILEHVNLWVVSRVSQERARAIRSSTALLRYTVTLPEFDISAEFPRMGHHVAQLALFVSDPDKDISRQAREGTYRLYQLLLQQRGLTIHDAEDLWCYDWHQTRRLLGYKNTARVGENIQTFEHTVRQCPQPGVKGEMGDFHNIIEEALEWLLDREGHRQNAAPQTPRERDCVSLSRLPQAELLQQKKSLRGASGMGTGP
ncbi:maestro heat-like repeat family member 5 [Chelonia mydas]|uniref:maestro heat-like repeat family member 5 n=1 Tax=Chelonia mydas TaxID=8469 RepID=UPI001CA9DF77|nr:maestro heat-like repeat family member 5 [Chelonia mydas]